MPKTPPASHEALIAKAKLQMQRSPGCTPTQDVVFSVLDTLGERLQSAERERDEAQENITALRYDVRVRSEELHKAVIAVATAEAALRLAQQRAEGAVTEMTDRQKRAYVGTIGGNARSTAFLEAIELALAALSPKPEEGL